MLSTHPNSLETPFPATVHGEKKMCVIGASLSKPHTSVTAFAEVVCMSVRGHIS